MERNNNLRDKKYFRPFEKDEPEYVQKTGVQPEFCEGGLDSKVKIFRSKTVSFKRRC